MSAQTPWRHRAFAALILALLLLGLEGVARLLYGRFSSPRGRAAVAVLEGREDAFSRQLNRPHPYLLYVNNPGFEWAGIRQINSLGYRGPEMTLRPAPGTTRILAIGGSTTFGHLVRDPLMTWPKQLEQRLNAAPGTRVEVVNGGLNDATSAELLSHYLFRHRYLGARFVIIHEGGNDTVPLMLPDYHPEYTHARKGWTESPLAPRPGERTVLRSGLGRFFYSWWLRNTSLSYLITMSTVWFQRPPEENLRNVRANEPEGFRRNLDLLIRNILADGATPVLFHFVLVPPERLPRLPSSSEFLKRHYEAIAEGLRKNRKVMEELAGQYGIPVVDLPPGAMPVENFLDVCHVNEAGERVKAQYVREVLAPLVANPPR
jgi:lysophospholipase L1-like esterase